MKLYGIFGPTCSGKTKRAIELALELKTEIISCDSRQIFKELNIGVARPSKEELATIPHHFIGEKSIFEPYSAGKFEREALERIELLSKKYENLVLVGGSTLYIDALLNGLDSFIPVPLEIKNFLEQGYLKDGLSFLQKKLLEVDDEHYQIIDSANPRRMIRALEIILTAQKTMGEIRKEQAFQKKKDRPFTTENIWLHPKRGELYERINQRCDEMMDAGLLEEVKNLHSFKDLPSLNTVGYSEFFDFLEGKTNYKDSLEKFKQHTRNYAKRQITWFNKKFEGMGIE